MGSSYLLLEINLLIELGDCVFLERDCIDTLVFFGRQRERVVFKKYKLCLSTSMSVFLTVISYHSLIKVTLFAKGYLALQDLVWSLPLSLTWFLNTLGLLLSTVATMDFSYFFSMPSTFSSRTCVLAMTSSQNSASRIFPCLISLTHSGLYSTILPRG